MTIAALTGFTVGITADRRWREQAELLERRGAKVLHGPSIRTMPLGSSEPLRRAIEDVIAAPPDVVLLTTGVGTRGWFAAADSHGLGDALRHALAGSRVLARGPKSAGAALTEGLDVSWSAPTETSDELLGHLGEHDVGGATVAVQLDGREDPVLGDAVRRLGATRVIDVPVYRWVTPPDTEPARRLVVAACEGRLDAVTFTSAPAAENLAAIADDAGRGEQLRAVLSGAVPAVCVGPVCAAAAQAAGFGATIAPDRSRLGAMVRTLASALAGRHRRFAVDGVELVLQGSVAVVDGGEIELADRERAVLDVLAERPGVVVSKGSLLHRVWGPGGVDEHAVEVTVARLRRRLGPAGGAIETSVRRGYRLVADAPDHAVTGPRSG